MFSAKVKIGLEVKYIANCHAIIWMLEEEKHQVP